MECYDRWASRKVSPLQGPNSSDDEHLVDFPLRDADVHGTSEPEIARPVLAVPVDPSERGEASSTLMFASTAYEPPRRGISTWLIAAASLVVGMLIGYGTSGFRIGQDRVDTPVPETSPASTSGSATSGKPFSESTVEGPVRVDEPPIVTAPPAQAKPEAQAKPAAPVRQPAATPAAAPKPIPAATPRAIDRPAPEPSRPAEITPTGPARMDIVSRPAGAQVFLDGRSVGTTPMSLPEISPGSHVIRLELAGFNRWVTTVDVQAGSSTRVAASLEQ